jgi:hypothetical protein
MEIDLLKLKEYTELVRYETEKVVHLVDGYDKNKRGLSGMTGSYQIDHIIPVREGFLKNIPFEEIASLNNLQFITWEENNDRRSNQRFKFKFDKCIPCKSNNKKQIIIDDREYNYFIYDTGRVENLRGDVIPGRVGLNGYSNMRISIKNSKKRKYISTHRLVALHFILNPENKKEVNHIDSDKLNNHYSNLEWVTSSENKIHTYKMGNRSQLGSKNNLAKLSEDDVLKIRKSNLTPKRLSEIYKVDINTIYRVLNRKIWKHI